MKHSEEPVLIEFMLRLGQAYLACGEQTAQVELFLRRVATVRGLRRPRVVAFPTALFVAASSDSTDHVNLTDGATRRLRLDQIAAVYALGDSAQRGAIGPHAGLEQLEAIYLMRPRFGTIGSVLGHAVLVVGMAAVLLPTRANLLAAGVLGLIVGTLKATNRDQPILAAPLSVVAAGLVSALVFLAVDQGIPLDPQYALIPPLVTFLPGAMLAFGLVELTHGDTVSGSSRLSTGIVQLVLLAFGLTAGALVVGYRVDNLLDGPAVVVVPLWASLTGLLAFGLGVAVHFSAPERSLAWILLVLMAAYTIQRLAAEGIGSEVSGFFGMVIATMLGNMIYQYGNGPPSMVTFLPAFWLLVPGALGLTGVKKLLTDSASASGLIPVVFGFTSIALGALVGESLYHWLERSIRTSASDVGS